MSKWPVNKANFKICNKCEQTKELKYFEFRKDKNFYRNTCKNCRNAQRRNKYDNPIKILERQLVNLINKSYERKGYKREKKYEDILGCSIEDEIKNLLFSYYGLQKQKKM